MMDLLAIGKTVIETELKAIQALQQRLDQSFSNAVIQIIDHKGPLFITGMGKSGYIAQKFAATLASTGTPAVYIHPAEALHGDIGMMPEHSLLIVISQSGNTSEVVDMLPYCRQHHIDVISIGGNINSTIAKHAISHLDTSVAQEACQNDLAPTASTTTALTLCDALAVTVSTAKDFQAEEFATRHPAGSLGKRLLTRVEDLMHTHDELPKVNKDANILTALSEISRKRLGVTLVKDGDNYCGIFTDGDLRRAIEKGANPNDSINSYITHQFSCTNIDDLAYDALQQMQQRKITSLPVKNQDNQIIGLLHIHDLLNAGLA